EKIIKHKKPIVITVVILALISTIAQFAVSVNYNMVDYLPEDAPSMQAMDLMEDEFDEPIPNARVMVRDVSITEALAYKEKLESIDGVTGVTWLDDVIDLKKPLEMADPDTVEPYYQDEKALFSLNIREGDEVKTTDQIYDLIG